MWITKVSLGSPINRRQRIINYWIINYDTTDAYAIAIMPFTTTLCIKADAYISNYSSILSSEVYTHADANEVN